MALILCAKDYCLYCTNGECLREEVEIDSDGNCVSFEEDQNK